MKIRLNADQHKAQWLNIFDVLFKKGVSELNMPRLLPLMSGLIDRWVCRRDYRPLLQTLLTIRPHCPKTGHWLARTVSGALWSIIIKKFQFWWFSNTFLCSLFEDVKYSYHFFCRRWDRQLSLGNLVFLHDLPSPNWVKQKGRGAIM